MLETLRDVAKNRIQTILIAWFVPVILGVYAFVLAVLPDVRDSGVVQQIRTAVQLLAVSKFLFILVASIAIATFMQMNRSFMYKVIEGDVWPHWLREWRRQRAHIPYHRYLLAKQQHSRAVSTVDQLSSEPAADADLPRKLAAAQDAEKLCKQKLADAEEYLRSRGRNPRFPGWLWRRRRPLLTPPENRRRDDSDWIPTYPLRETQVMPTRVGNELKAMETFGANTYGLDSQILWYELYSTAPDALRTSIDDRELQADTFVAGLYVAAGFLASVVSAAIWKWTSGHFELKLWIIAAIGGVLMVLLHRGLLAAIDEWSATVRALVNNGRLGLREKYDLRKPVNATEERAMWEALTGSVYYGAKYYFDKLDAFRSPPATPSPTPNTATPTSPTSSTSA